MKSLVEFQGGVVRCRVWWSSEDLTKGEQGVGVEQSATSSCIQGWKISSWGLVIFFVLL